MDWNRLYDLQQHLDERILNTIPQSRSDIYLDKVLALNVEVGELANETRCFKYWSQKGPSDREVILEEYVDGIHFILSLGLDFGYRFNDDNKSSQSISTLTEGFHLVYKHIELFKQSKSQDDYITLMNSYLALGEQLSFSTNEVVQAYLSKNEENHNRQQTGY
ncbi:dimeric dUTPase (all-alpha-NTP-PPase superfamily) [Alkalibacillus filiformis]|uniref:Dimeric dUTPase (All-alpha-NTP-PPase superfamily) n=1 Tax=Alkalibacillus filiformis TaxID=200990 RepID=A0ABU0DRY5_9BACI|nr:dUTP diphosphatase [Alkalibacillus filiformis]MDQ0351211.1 dimeric dUTPase (all-alpha-NTP-PPase superfamily) [Alkalibacillus filiformis]